MSHWHRKSYPLSIARAEIFAQFQQYQGDSFLKRAAHEIRAAQLHQIPAPGIAGGHVLEVCGGDSERDLDEVARLTVPIWQSVTASQRKLYLIPVTAGERPESCPARP